MNHTRVGIIGLGSIGKVHLRALGECDDLEVVGLADSAAATRASIAAEYDLPVFADHQTLLRETSPDTVAICTPHFTHAEIAIDAMRQGAHVYIEKPMTVRASRAAEVIAVANECDRQVQVGFGRRLRPTDQKLKQLLEAGAVGTVQRVTMVLTDWFRSQHYYDSASWRGSWAGEGGGVLVNQAPHDLDLICWLLGLPSAVCAEIGVLGHDIEVEDNLSALLKWDHGATGTLQVNTHEAPGRCFLEITGTRGTLTLDNGRLTAVRMGQDTRHYSDTTRERMRPPEKAETISYQLQDSVNRYAAMHRNLAQNICQGTPLICTAAEGLQEVELANALLLSGLRQTWVEPPVDRATFNEALETLIATRSMSEARRRLRGSSIPVIPETTDS